MAGPRKYSESEVREARDRMERNLRDAGNPAEKAREIAKRATERFADDRRKADKE